MRKISNILHQLFQTWRKYLDDQFILLGLALIVYATYRISLTAAIYVAGILFLGFGILLMFTAKKAEK